MAAIASGSVRHRPRHPSRWVVTFLAGALCAVWLVPLWILVITAMKTTPEYASNPSQWTLPENPLRILANIRDAWSAAGLGPGFVASVIYGVVGAALAIICASLGAYSITRLRVRGALFWFVLVFSGTMFPFQMYLIPLFQMYQTIGLYDTRVGMICFYTAISIPFCLLVMRGFFATIPGELQDAARVDGSGDFGILWRIFVPLAKGPVAVLFLFQFIWIWNDLVFGLVLSTSDGIRPITPSLAGLQGQYSSSGPPLVMGGALIATVPTVLLFLLLGRYLMQGLQLTATRA
ncbi:MAG: carbohydrate ABC transporter permease [Microlunatus sp.]|nr:carbohydrate ABC transporter permease [Microlunatus sp.]